MQSNIIYKYIYGDWGLGIGDQNKKEEYLRKMSSIKRINTEEILNHPFLKELNIPSGSIIIGPDGNFIPSFCKLFKKS